MITYKDLFKLIKALPETGSITAHEGSEIYRKLSILDRMEIVQAAELDTGYCAFYPHPKQIKPSVLVVDIPAVTGPASDLGRVRVDWSGRGHSSGAYRVVADKGKFVEIAFDLELGVTRKMVVAKERTKAAA